MKDNIREQIDIFKNFRSINEAVKTKCQTEGAIYNGSWFMVCGSCLGLFWV
jgi:hypothetical protein